MSDPTRPSIRETRRDQVFPRLDERQLAALLPLGERRRYDADAILYHEGERHFGMFVVLEGTIDVTRRTNAGEELIAKHGPGVFTGEVVGFDCEAARDNILVLDGGERVEARVVVIATGARYRKPALARLESFEGRGIYYGASFMEAKLCQGQEVIVVGGGNSAGQAAVFLAGHARHVHVLVRSTGLAASMSDYLVQRITATPNVTLRTETEIVELLGDGALAGVRWKHRGSGAVEERAIGHVFLFLGAEPNTGWLTDCLALDAAGFVKTGRGLNPEDLDGEVWPPRPPMRLETSHPGVFAVGDVRSGSVKRVAAAVGEGSTAVQLVHLYLAETET